MSTNYDGHDGDGSDTETAAERVGRETVADRARSRLRAFREEYLDAIETIDGGDEPTAEDLRDLRVAHRELQDIVETDIARVVDGAEPWEGAADRIPYGKLAEAFGVSLEELKAADPGGDLDEE